MTTLTLTKSELEELTGAKRRKQQQTWLSDNGIKSVIGADGQVKVLRAAVEARLMQPATRVTGERRTEPNFALMVRKAG